MADVCGFTHPIDQFAYSNWVSEPLNLPGTHLPQNDGLAVHANWLYTWGNPLAILRFLVCRPEEWGFCEPRPMASFVTEVNPRGPLATQRWAALMGSRDYELAAVSPSPYAVCIYGIYAANII